MQFFGALWFLISVERQERCWREECWKQSIDTKFLYCGENRNSSEIDLILEKSCQLINPDDITNSTIFNFGIFTDALQSGAVEKRNFVQKFFYCFWWGLRNLRFVYTQTTFIDLINVIYAYKFQSITEVNLKITDKRSF